MNAPPGNKEKNGSGGCRAGTLSGGCQVLRQPLLQLESGNGLKRLQPIPCVCNQFIREIRHFLNAFFHTVVDPSLRNPAVPLSASREKLVRRLKEAVQRTAEVFGGSAEIEMISRAPPLVCDPAMTDEMVSYMQELPIPGLTSVPNTSASASEDFGAIAEKVPGVFMYLSAGYMDGRGDAPAHNLKIQINEDVCPVGSDGALCGSLAGRSSVSSIRWAARTRSPVLMQASSGFAGKSRAQKRETRIACLPFFVTC